MSTAFDELSAILREAGLPPEAVWMSNASDTTRPPEGVWVVVLGTDSVSLGAIGRGTWAEYASVPSVAEAAHLAVRLLTEPPTRSAGPPDDVLARAGAQTAEAIRERTRLREGRAGLAMVAPGDTLDVVGPDTGHHLYALGTPFAERSQSPADIGSEYHRYRVAGALVDGSEGIAAPWFAQPGGGAMLVLEHPIRWYVDQGALAELE